MSLSWPDRLQVQLAPTRVTVTRSTGLVRRRASTDSRAVAPADAATAPWRGAVEAFVTLLAAGPARRARVTVALSSHFCRYAVVPGNAGLAGEAEVEGYARLHFEAIHGAAAVAGWEVRAGAGAPGAPRLACAIDLALLEALRAACAGAGVRLATVEPRYTQAFDAARARRTARSFWFAVAEEGRLVLGAVKDGEWRTVLSERVPGDAPTVARDLIDRALVRLPDMTEDTLYWHDDAAPRAAGCGPAGAREPVRAVRAEQRAALKVAA